MLVRAGERFGCRPKRVAADTAYGSAAFLAFVRDRGTSPRSSAMLTPHKDRSWLAFEQLGAGSEARQSRRA